MNRSARLKLPDYFHFFAQTIIFYRGQLEEMIGAGRIRNGRNYFGYNERALTDNHQLTDFRA